MVRGERASPCGADMGLGGQGLLSAACCLGGVRLKLEQHRGCKQRKMPKEIVSALLLQGSLVGLKWVAESALMCSLPFAHFI